MLGKTKAFVEKYLASSVEAQEFAYSYVIHIHAVDDIIDGDKTDAEFIIKCFDFTVSLCSCRFYRQYCHLLEPVMHAVANMYADSVVYEKSTEQWKKDCAEVFRHSGNEVLLAVVGIVAGIDKKREASLELRELAYVNQKES